MTPCLRLSSGTPVDQPACPLNTWYFVMQQVQGPALLQEAGRLGGLLSSSTWSSGPLPARVGIWGAGRLQEQSPLLCAHVLHVILQVPQLTGFGDCFKSSQPIQLTEEETEYMVVVVKHVFDEHIVFQFNCTNTVKEQILEGVSITMDLAEAVSAALCSAVGLGCSMCNPARDHIGFLTAPHTVPGLW